MSRIIEHIASRYRDSTAGRTGAARRDLLFGFNELLKSSNCLHGPERHEAIAELERLESQGVIVLERHRRDHSAILKVRLLKTAIRVGAEDIRRATIETPAIRCVTVENAAMLHELAKLSSGTLLASSGSEGGFANSAVITFLKALPSKVELWHFGDSDPKGFDILRDLRERSGRDIHSLHMGFRPSFESPTPLVSEDMKTIARLLASDFLTAEEKVHIEKMKQAGHRGDFEQESLGKPSADWPYY